MTSELLMSPSAGPEEIQLLQKLEEANRLVVHGSGEYSVVGNENQRLCSIAVFIIY